jgi:hypothetical protein
MREEEEYLERAQQPERPAARPDVEHPEEGDATSPGSSAAARHDVDIDAVAAERAREQSEKPENRVEEERTDLNAESDEGQKTIDELQRRKPK